MSTDPRLSVVVPAHQGAAVLPRALAALLESDLPRSEWELIVVDDASTDGSAEVARAHADQVMRLAAPPAGPGNARNRGSELARGEILVFIDADVCVHPATLRGFLKAFDGAPDVGAVFGAYDSSPHAPGLVSQYRNLMHHYVHLQCAGEAETFWAGCGAIRKAVFEQVAGFDAQRYARPQVEDIELGHRVRDLGYRILLRPELQGKHLKRWDLRGMVLTDVRDRGVPWTRLLLASGGPDSRRNTLNLRPAEKLFTASTGLAAVALVTALVTGQVGWAMLAGALVAVVVIGNLRLLRWFVRQRGFSFTLGVVPLRLLYYLLNGISVAGGLVHHVWAAAAGDGAVRSSQQEYR